MATVRAAIAGLETSRIRRVVSHAMGRPGVIPLWFGEPDEPTPGFIIAAAERALDAGETFYTLNRGIPALRTAIADYLHGLRGRAITEERISVTASGMNAIMMTMQALLGPGDNIVMPEPYWPNIPATAEIVGATVRTVPLAVRGDAFTLDLARLFDRVDGATRAILINSPANPTGWMMTTEDQRTVLDFCRARGLWLIADEVYDRITYDGAPAPSFLDHAEAEDPLVVINSFSKSWAMTGWRVGWLVAPERLGPQIDKLIEYNIACAPAMAQRAAITALAEGEPFIAASVARYRGNRDLVVDRLAPTHGFA